MFGLLPCFILFQLFLAGDGYKFLVFASTSSRSHMIGKGRLADALAAGGHDVTVLAIQSGLSASAFKFTDQRVVPISVLKEGADAKHLNSKKILTEMAFSDKSLFSSYEHAQHFAHVLADSCKNALLTSQKEIEQLKNEKFDAMFVGQLFPCGSALSKVLGIKVHFLINSCPYMDFIAPLMGLPMPVGYVPSTGDVRVSDEMSFTDRLWNSFETYLNFEFARSYELVNNVFKEEYGSDFPDVKTIIQQSPLTFTFVDTLIDFPRPIFARDIYVGGLGMSTSSKKKLDAQFQTEVNKGKKGSIFFSLGSNTNSAFIPSVSKKNLIDAFAQLVDYHFIVKLDKEDAEGIDYARSKENIFVTNWAPQNELLQESHLKLFVSHGGYNSLLEVAHSGKPCLLMPMMFDQTRNCMTIQRNGWGKIFDRKSLETTSDVLVRELRQILEDPKYTEAAARISKLLKSKPFTPTELLLKNVQFVMENGGVLPELAPASIHMSTMKQFNLDIYALLAVVVAIFAVSVTYVFSLALKRVFRTKNSWKKQQ